MTESWLRTNMFARDGIFAVLLYILATKKKSHIHTLLNGLHITQNLYRHKRKRLCLGLMSIFGWVRRKRKNSSTIGYNLWFYCHSQYPIALSLSLFIHSLSSHLSATNSGQNFSSPLFLLCVAFILFATLLFISFDRAQWNVTKYGNLQMLQKKKRTTHGPYAVAPNKYRIENYSVLAFRHCARLLLMNGPAKEKELRIKKREIRKRNK